MDDHLIKLIYNKYSDYEDELDVDGSVVLDEVAEHETKHENYENSKSAVTLGPKEPAVSKVNASESFKDMVEEVMDSGKDLSASIDEAQSKLNETNIKDESPSTDSTKSRDLPPGPVNLSSNTSSNTTLAPDIKPEEPNESRALKVNYLNLNHLPIDNSLTNNNDDSSENDAEDDDKASISNELKPDLVDHSLNSSDLEPRPMKPLLVDNNSTSNNNVKVKSSNDLETNEISPDPSTSSDDAETTTDHPLTSDDSKMTTMVNPQNPQFLECINACGTDHECVRNKCLMDSTYFG